MSGQDHRRAGWTYGPRPRGTCAGCRESKVLDTHGLIVTHRGRLDARLTAYYCSGSRQPPQEETMNTVPDSTEPQDVRMARFVQAVQTLSRCIAATRSALDDSMAAFAELHTAMRQADLLPEGDLARTGPHATDREDAVRSAALDTVAEALNIPREFLTGTSEVDHWSAFAPVRQMPPPGTGQRVRSQDDLTGPVSHPIGGAPTDVTHPADPDDYASPVSALTDEVAARYCPDCSHPYSYAAEGSCCMPVNTRTGLPVAGPNEPARRCGCTVQDPASDRGREKMEDPS